MVSGTASAKCDLTGSYVRTTPGTPDATVDIAVAQDGLAISLDAYGPRMYDGNPTFGGLEGVAILANDDQVCVALLNPHDEECSVTVAPVPGGIRVTQFGQCLTFGANVEASGVFRREPKRSRGTTGKPREHRAAAHTDFGSPQKKNGPP